MTHRAADARAERAGFTITRKLVVMLLAFGVGPLALLAAIALSAISSIERDLRKELVMDAGNISETIDRNLFERYGDAQAFGQNAVVLERASWYERGTRNDIAAAMDRSVDTYDLYYLRLFVDLDGKLIAVNDRDADGAPLDTSALYAQSYRDASWFQALSQGKSTTHMPFSAKENQGARGTYVEEMAVSANELVGLSEALASEVVGLRVAKASEAPSTGVPAGSEATSSSRRRPRASAAGAGASRAPERGGRELNRHAPGLE